MLSVLDLYEAAAYPSTQRMVPMESALAAWICARAFNAIVHSTMAAYLFKDIARLHDLLDANGLGNEGVDLCAAKNVARVRAVLHAWVNPGRPGAGNTELEIGSHRHGGRGASIII